MPGDVLREGIRILSQVLMETEVAGLIGAERHERTGERSASRHGSRRRTWGTRMGTIELAIPKVKPGTYFLSLLQPRRRAEHALLAVVQEAYVHGVSTRKVADLVKALGVDGISKSEVSRSCGRTVAERRYFSAASMQQLTTPTLSSTVQEIVAAIA